MGFQVNANSGNLFTIAVAHIPLLPAEAPRPPLLTPSLPEIDNNVHEST